MADKRVSELPATTTLGPNDLVYVVQAGNGRRITVSSLLNSLNAPVTQSSHSTVIVGSSVVISNGATPTAPWFSFDNTVYDYCDLQFAAKDNTTSAYHCYGNINILWKANGTSSGVVENMTGHIDAEEITVPAPDITNTTSVNVRFVRSGNTSITTGNITVRWRATLFRR